MSAKEISGEFARLDPWVTGFLFNGVPYGGRYTPTGDPRAAWFIEWLGSLQAGSTILECGCLEGGHTLMLANAFPEARVVAVDVRRDNLAKAETVVRIAATTNVEFLCDDLDDPARVFARQYDAVFCVGLLYHLRDPQSFLKRTCAASPRLWLWTIYCAEAEARSIDGTARGRLLPEFVEHPLAAVRPESYLPTLGALVSYLWAAGYTDVRLVRNELTTNGNGPAVLLAATR